MVMVGVARRKFFHFFTALCRIPYLHTYRREFRSQIFDLWTDAATGLGSVRGERVSRNKIDLREKVEKSRTQCFSNVLQFRWVEYRLAKAAGAELSGGMSDQQLHAAVARSTFRSQNVESITRLARC